MRSSAARVRAAQGKIVNRECCKSETKTFAGQDFSPRVLQVQGLQLCLDGRPVFLDAGRRCAGAPLRSQLFCVSMCLGGGRGGEGGGVSCLSCSAALLIHAAARLAVRRGRLSVAEPLCIRIYTCVCVCIRVYTHAYMCM